MSRNLFACLILGVPAIAAGQAVDYNRDVRPILSQSCFPCHGPDSAKRKADLRLDTNEGLFTPRDDGPPVAPGDPAASLILARLAEADPLLKMPPPRANAHTPTDAQVATLRRWVEQGATWQGHWAYQPPRSEGKIGKASIDTYVRAKLDHAGLKPAAEADRRTLIRRLSIDLLGLPPTPEEVDAFIADRRPDAYENLVDRTLASPRHGERLAMLWLDLVRYADTTGLHNDVHRDVSAYRDYVVGAFNDNKPFDAFTVEQLAGDLLPDPSPEQRIASGYNHLILHTEEGGAQAKEYVAKYAADRVRNASSVWMGATLGCAECHDHKFDPWSQKDFYRFAAFFADLREPAVGTQEQVKVASRAQQMRLDESKRQMDAADHSAGPPDLTDLAAERAAILAAVPSTLVARAAEPRVMRVLARGNWQDDSGEVVTPAVPAALRSGEPSARQSRLDLARWLVDPGNSLTARVFVNRLWKLAFGRGLVASLDDFGAQGSMPTHPELLDALAVEFVRSGWDVRHMLKLMVESSTYRQSSLADESARQRDPGNDLIARQGRWRLDAEMVRDNALAVSGLLVQKLGGPSAKPYQPAGYWVHLNFPRREYQPDHGDELYRRGLYTYWCRTFLHPSLSAFDAPSREECKVDRPRSNTPLQALVLLNDPTYVEAARALAERVVRDGGTSGESRLDHAYRLVLDRKPRPAEVATLRTLYHEHLNQYRADPAAAEALLKTGERPAPADLDHAELAAWTSVARVLLNLHETIARN